MHFLIGINFSLLVFLFSFRKDESNVGCIIITSITFIVTWLSMFLAQPVLSFAYGGWLLWLLIPVVMMLIEGIAVSIDDDELFLRPFIPAIFCIVAGVVVWFSSGSLFRAESKQKMLCITELSDSTYCKDMAKICPESMNLVDDELAVRYANAVLEQDPATGSVCDVKNVYMQNLNGSFSVTLATGEQKTLTFRNEQVYIAPLEHSGLFKWQKNRTTPGYIIVSAMKQNVVYFVTAINGEPLKLRYLESGYFGNYYLRYLRHHGYANVKFSDNNIEIDDHGRPYMVLPVYRNTVGYSAPEIRKVVVLDVQTGDIQEYTMNNIPKWIERVYPTNLISKRISWWGKYIHGFGNSLFAKKGIRVQTPGIEQVYSDGKCYWYTGISSAGADDATSGFMLIDTRTGQSNLYQISGVNEEAAKKNIASHKIDAANINPSRVLMYNIANEPTYFATAKNDAGEKIGYAFASVRRRDVCGTGKEIDEAYNNYLASLRSSTKKSILDGKVEEEAQTFTIRDVCMEMGNYYFIFNETNGEYLCPMDISKELKWSRAGDTVKVSIINGDHTHRIEYFDNVRVNL